MTARPRRTPPSMVTTEPMLKESVDAIIASTDSRQLSRRWSGPPNPKVRPGQKPVAKAPAVEIILLADSKVDALADARLADLAEIAERIKARIKRTTADVIATGKDLLLAQQRIGAGDLLSWVERELGMTRRWAQLQMRVAQTLGANEIISSVPPTFLYLLAAPSTSDPIRNEVVADLQAGRVIDHRAVEARIKQEREGRRLAKERGVVVEDDAALDDEVVVVPEKSKSKRTSRPAHWADAAARALAALEELQEIQAEFEDWKERLHENTQDGAMAEKLENITGIDIAGAIEIVTEAQDADLPLGFGRD